MRNDKELAIEAACTEPIVELIDVGVGFGDRRVLDGLTLRIDPRAITVIVGESGSGKTVLLKVMMGLIRPDRGTVKVFGRDLATLSPLELVATHRRMAMLFQNYALFDALSVEDNVEFPVREGRESARDPQELAHSLLELLDLEGSEQLLPAELSGGMRKRVGLARALVTRPEITLFDEPTTGLDPIMVERVDTMLARATRERAMTSIVISHDLASIQRIADHVAFLHGGKIIFEGTRDQLIASELAPIRRFVEASRPAPKSELVPPGEPAIELIDVHKRFGSKEVLRGVDFTIHRGGITALIGASGSGKSVIAKHIIGLLRPEQGKVVVFGTDIVGVRERELLAIRKRMGLVFQHAALLDWLTIAENIAFPLDEHGHSEAEVRTRVREVLARLDLVAFADRLPGELSAGERKRAALARAIADRPDLLIYDEPTTGQDPLRTAEIDALILHAQAQFDITSLVISHDMTSVFRIADRIAMLHDGTIVAAGTPDELRRSTEPQVRKFLGAAGIELIEEIR